jgi:oligopeptide transport system substrate-binding protein
MNIGRRELVQAGLAAPLALARAAPAAASAAQAIDIGLGPDLDTLDPHRSSTLAASTLMTEVFEGLASFDAMGKIIPGVAERWEVSREGLRWVFYLRRDSRWADGSPVTAHDFVFAWRRAVTPQTLLALPEWLAPVQNSLKIIAGNLPPEALGARAIDDWTLQVDLEHPKPDFIFYTAYWPLSPLHRPSLEKHGAAFVQPGKLIGNGPYQLATAVPQVSYGLIVNPFHRDAERLRIRTVNFHVTEDLQTELKRFRSGELLVTKSIPPSQLDWVKTNLADLMRLTYQASTFFLVPNLLVAPWKDNSALARALAMAIDRKTIVEKVTKGGELPAYSITPPGLAGYVPPKVAWAELTDGERMALARAELAKAGYGPGSPPLEVELLYNTSELNRQVAVAVGAMWQEVLGVKALLTNQEFRVVVSRLRRRDYKGVTRISWGVGLACEYLGVMRSRSNSPGPAYLNAAFDAAMERVDAAAGMQEWHKRLAEAERIALEDMPMIPILHQSSRRLVSKRVEGWLDNLFDIHPVRFLALKD